MPRWLRLEVSTVCQWVPPLSSADGPMTRLMTALIAQPGTVPVASPTRPHVQPPGLHFSSLSDGPGTTDQLLQFPPLCRRLAMM